MPELVIFDWDDNFARDATKGYMKCYKPAVQGVGVHYSDSDLKEVLAPRWGDTHFRQLIELLPGNIDLLPEAVEIYEEHYFGNTFIDELKVVKGSAKTIRRLKQRDKTLAIVSGVHPELLTERIMPKLGFDPGDFSQVVTSYDYPGNPKPDPFMAELVMEKLKIPPEETILVGDSANDVKMARAAGIEPVVTLAGHLKQQEAEELGVKYIIEDVTKVLRVIDIIERLNRRVAHA